ncbi:MAG: thioredoxin family protein [Bacteroidales bacterium]|nr:thioredoxin family protein [Bacteroidales bacterium]MCF8343855.1 thioredoxin family protein [Bacteroidales bacterium]MCF8349579.1 thioredoxin family protein [Bacteroidales bacterium]MCF8375138.1 thioredoxin family protein [Bacteroidales bacterium]MCF8400045.1 thioredoxin family protein [Bacteroidales bacterium]
MEIKILGTGCPKCKTLEKLTRETVEKEGIEANITKENDIIKIMEYGIMKTPGLVIDEKVVFSGRVPSAQELNALLTNNK